MTLSSSRRRFITITPFAGMALLAACQPKSEPAPPAASSVPAAPVVDTAPAPAVAATPNAKPPMVDEKDAQAIALGYVADATKADTARFKNYVAGNQCSNCMFYQGQAGESAGPCTVFGGKGVAAKGWCTSWAKKA
jgi:hypothetical protein